MAISQNGWEANNRALITTIEVPGGRLAVRAGDVATIFAHLAEWYNREVEPLVWPGNWGYAERAIRGGVETSNHASGTAVDFNAPQHPLGTQPEANFSKSQLQKIRQMVQWYEGVLRWGGDYTGRKDGMHWEINANAGAVARVAAKIRGGAATPPTPAPTDTSVWPLRSGHYFGDIKGPAESHGGAFAWERPYIVRIQQALQNLGFAPKTAGWADGKYEGPTVNAVAAWQRARMPGTTRFGEVWSDDWAVLIRGAAAPQAPAPAPAPAPVAPSFPYPRDHSFGLKSNPSAKVHGGINAQERAYVKLIQQQLIRIGAVPGQTNPNSGWADGIFEEPTRQAVIRFQQKWMPGTTIWGQIWWDDWAKLFSF